MKQKKYLAILLTVLMVATLFAGCANNSKPDETSAQSQSTTVKTEATTTEKQYDLSGFQLDLRTEAPARYYPQDNFSELHNQWKSALKEMESKYNFRVNIIAQSTSIDDVTAAAMAGTTLADFIQTQQTNFMGMAKNGAIEYLNSERMRKAGFDPYDEDCWDQGVTSMTTYNGNVYAVNAGGKYVTKQCGTFILFNKKLTEAKGYDIYQLVKNKQWTWDVFLNVAKATTQDTNADGTIDIYGINNTHNSYEMFTNGGTGLIGQDNSGKWVAINNQRAITSLQYYVNMNDPKIHSQEKDWNVKLTNFAEGKGVMGYFLWYHISDLTSPIRNAAFDYGMVPAPMGPDATGYCSVLDAVDSWVMQNNNQDYQMAAIAMSLWGDLNTDDDWAVQWQDGRLRDKESLEMLTDYIMPVRYLNLNRICKPGRTVVNTIIDEVLKGASISATLDAHQAELQSALDGFFGQ